MPCDIDFKVGDAGLQIWFDGDVAAYNRIHVVNRLQEILRRTPRRGISIPPWLDRLLSVGIVARDPPVKGPPGRVDHRQSAKESTGSDALSGDATSPHQTALRCTGAPFPLPERTRRAGRVRAGGNDDKARSDAPKRPKEHHVTSRRASTSDRQR